MQNNDQQAQEQPNEFESVKARLEEIARAVEDENVSLDEALDLYEEAVKLGLQASDLLEVGVVIDEGQQEEPVEGGPAGQPTEGGASGNPASNQD